MDLIPAAVAERLGCSKVVLPAAPRPLTRKERRKLSQSEIEMLLGRLEPNPAIIEAWGAKACKSERKRIAGERRALEHDVPSQPWFDEQWEGRRAAFPPGGADTGMITSDVSGRVTPPNALAVEDALDAMTPEEALYYEFPQSPSAASILAIGASGATPVGGAW